MVDLSDLAAIASDVRKARDLIEDVESRLDHLEDVATVAWGPLRDVTTKSSRDAIVGETQLALGLRTHMAWLILSRLSLDLDAERKDARKKIIQLRDGTTVRVSDIARQIRNASHEQVAQPIVEAWAQNTGELSRIARQRRELRHELATRLGYPSEVHCGIPVDRDALAAAAQAFLDGTEDLMMPAMSRVWRDVPASHRATASILYCLRRDAKADWPSQISLRWFGQWCPHLAFDRLEPKSGEALARRLFRWLPERIGGSSFARLFYLVGFAAAETVPESSMAWAERADPRRMWGHLHGALFASLTANAAFLSRQLSMSKSAASDEARAASLAFLWETRLRAAKVLWTDSSARELSERVFGGPFLPGLQGVWPERIRPEEFLTLLAAPALEARMRDVFDEDWYRNPRSSEHFLAAEGFPATKIDPNVDARRLISWFEARIA